MIGQLETGDWNTRIHAVHELAYLQEEGLPGLAIAGQDGDWQVRMTAVHALGPMGDAAVPILKAMLKHEPCPVVRLMVLHNLGELAPEGEQENAMRWAFSASNAEVNACRDQAGPGRAPWVAGRGSDVKTKTPKGSSADSSLAVLPSTVSKKNVFEVPTRDKRYEELDVILFPEPAGEKEMLGPSFAVRRSTTAPVPELRMAVRPRREGPRPEMAVVRKKQTRQSLPPPLTPTSREEKMVRAPALIMPDGGGKAIHDPLPQLLATLKEGKNDERARAADEIGHLGPRAVSAVRPLAVALKDADPRVRSSASLALGNIGAASERAVPLLVRALKDDSPDVGYAAALALSRIGTPKALRAFHRYVGKEARRTIEMSHPEQKDHAPSSFLD